MKCNCESDHCQKRFHDISPQWLNAFVHSPKKKYNLRRTSKAFQPLKTAENWTVQYRKVISLGNWFWKIVVKYSKNPHHVRTCSAWQKRSFLNKTSLQFWWSKFWILIVWNFWQKVIVYMFSLIYICWEFHEKYVFHKATVQYRRFKI